MSVIQIRKATREGARLLIVIAGWTGSGKTVTALHLAYGIANYDASKVGFLDCENRRGSLNAHVLEHASRPTKEQFLIADLHPPFSPDRYVRAIREFQAAGVDVLIVDSGSHEWEGEGGCIDIADANKGMWNKAKGEHKRFMNVLLQTDMHIIVCVRAREKDKPEKAIVKGQEKTVYRELGLQPIQEKNFMFEATASLMMYDAGTRQETIKLPGELANILGRQQGYITADDGKAIRDWVDGARQLDPLVEKFRNRLISNTEGGVAHIENCWGQTPEDVRAALGEEFKKTLIESAKGFDELKATAEGNAPPSGSDPNAEAIARAAEQGRSQRSSAPSPATQTQTPPASSPTNGSGSAPAANAGSQPPTGTASGSSGASRTPRTSQPARAQRTPNHASPSTPATTRAPARAQTQAPPAKAAPKEEEPLF